MENGKNDSPWEKKPQTPDLGHIIKTALIGNHANETGGEVTSKHIQTANDLARNMLEDLQRVQQAPKKPGKP